MPLLTVPQLIERARSQVGKGTVYQLGGGNPDAGAFSCQDEDAGCDCATFVQWLLGLQRYRPDLAWLKHVNGGWYNTDGVWWDATREKTGSFEECEAQPGALIVYPSNWVSKVDGPKIGHIGFVTEADHGVARKVVHCSSGNFRRHNDAIQETDAYVWDVVGTTRFAWFAGVDRRPSA